MKISKCENPECENQTNNRFCCSKCGDRNSYLNNKEKYKLNARKWEQQNPIQAKKLKAKAFQKYMEKNKEKHRITMLKAYHKNKLKWDSRTVVYRFVKGMPRYKKISLLSDNCKRCNSSTNLRIHCETYPTKKEEVKKAIAKGEIYYLCKNCR